jgi:hypothetical protein
LVDLVDLVDLVVVVVVVGVVMQCVSGKYLGNRCWQESGRGRQRIQRREGREETMKPGNGGLMGKCGP